MPRADGGIMIGIKACCCVLVSLWAAGDAWAQDSRNGGHTLTLSRGAAPLESSKSMNANGTEGSGRKTPKPEGPVVLDFDTLPASPWQTWDCLDHVSKATVAG